MAVDATTPVQGTNDSACRSKASMESLGYLPARYASSFARHFVEDTGRPSKRAALINRGYAMRVMLVRECMLRAFRASELDAPGVQVVSLGAGFDTTYFWISSSSLFSNKKLVYIELDLPDVIAQKRLLIDRSTELSLLANSSTYHLIAADLRSGCLDVLLKDLVDPSLPTVFTSECVLSYLPATDADNVLSWAASSAIFGPARHLVMYEQLLGQDACLANGADQCDMFTETMLRHFERLQCPLKSSMSCPTIESQQHRLLRLGWAAKVQSLDRAYSDILPLAERLAFETTADVYDEHEEMAVKMAHYFVATAACAATTKKAVDFRRQLDLYRWSLPTASVKSHGPSLCRWGSAAALFGKGQEVLVCGGYGSVGNASPSRLSDIQILDIPSGRLSGPKLLGDAVPAPRLFHSMHLIGECDRSAAFKLYGGRTTPCKVLSDVWTLTLDKVACTANWTCLGSSPFAFFSRHQVAIDEKGAAWMLCNPHSPALVSDFNGKWTAHMSHPLISLAALEHFTLSIWRGSLYVIGSFNISIDLSTFKIEPLTILAWNHQPASTPYALPARKFHTAHSIDNTAWHGLVLVGGLSQSLSGINSSGDGNGTGFAMRSELSVVYVDLVSRAFLPLGCPEAQSLIKHASVICPSDIGFEVVSVGGGLVCFSMGSYYCPTMHMRCESLLPILPRPTVGQVQDAIRRHEPVILRGIDLGTATAKWTFKHLSENGPDQLVSAHVCESPTMTFRPRNFEFVVMPWREMLEQARFGPKLIYFRSIGTNPRKQAAHFHEAFPLLSADLRLPGDLFPQLLTDRYFSSVLRIGSAGMQLWMHYDVMDNILIQIVGRKQVTLWHPSDLPHLYIDGSASIADDLHDFGHFPLLQRAKPRSIVMEPGDVLFIPALWPHHVEALSSNDAECTLSVAVNVFWRSLDPSAYPKKDLYGNADPVAFAQLEKAVESLNDALPKEYADFYLCKLMASRE